MRQPWLPGSESRGADDFSPASATRPVRAVGLALGLALLLLAMGRAPQMLDAAYGLEPGPLADRVLAAAEAWDGLMKRTPIPAWLAAIQAG